MPKTKAAAAKAGKADSPKVDFSKATPCSEEVAQANAVSDLSVRADIVKAISKYAAVVRSLTRLAGNSEQVKLYMGIGAYLTRKLASSKGKRAPRVSLAKLVKSGYLVPVKSTSGEHEYVSDADGNLFEVNRDKAAIVQIVVMTIKDKKYVRHTIRWACLRPIKKAAKLVKKSAKRAAKRTVKKAA